MANPLRKNAKQLDIPARRRRAVRDAVASAALEGRNVTPAARVDLESFAAGQLTEDEMLTNFHARIAAKRAASSVN